MSLDLRFRNMVKRLLGDPSDPNKPAITTQYTHITLGVYDIETSQNSPDVEIAKNVITSPLIKPKRGHENLEVTGVNENVMYVSGEDWDIQFPAGQQPSRNDKVLVVTNVGTATSLNTTYSIVSAEPISSGNQIAAYRLFLDEGAVG